MNLMPRLADKVIFSVALTLLALDAYMQVAAGNSGDKNWLLLGARWWLDGRTIGGGIFEVNPPLILWLYAIPVWISEHLTIIKDSWALGLMGIGFTILSIGVSIRLIGLHPMFAGNAYRQAYFALLLASVLMFFNTPLYFFDRDNIMFVLTFPYMLRFMPALEGRRLSFCLRLSVGLLAALGFCIKPHSLIVFIALQAVVIFRERSLAVLCSLENCIIYTAGALYAFCVWHFAPDYIGVILPMAMETYSGYNYRINACLYLAFAFLSAGLTFVEFRPRLATPYRVETYYFVEVCVAFLAYALLNNGWGYTYSPLLSALAFLSGWMLWEYGWLRCEHEKRRQPIKQFVFGQRGCIINLALNVVYIVVSMAAFFTAICDKYDDCRQDEAYAAYLTHNHIRSFSTLAVNFNRWTAVARSSGALWGSRFNNLWMLPALLRDKEPASEQHQRIIEYVGRAYAQDLEYWKPEAIFVDSSNGVFDYPHPVDLVALFGRVPQFKEIWQRQYRYLTTIDNCTKSDISAEAQDKNAAAWPLIAADCRYSVYGRVP